jgi:signal transduction histidine kinase
LANVARHAQVRETTIRVWVDGETLAIQVEDEGVGFDAEAVMAAGRSNSLTGMRERTMLFGGRLLVESTPGDGTHLLVELPLNVHDGSKIHEHFNRLGR